MRIVLSNRPLFLADDVVVIDYASRCFWKGRERRPEYPGNPHYIAFRIVSALLVRMPRLVLHDEMFSHVWGDDENGGPLVPDKSRDVILFKAKPLFAWLGVTLENRFGFGYRLIPFAADPRIASPGGGVACLTSRNAGAKATRTGTHYSPSLSTQPQLSREGHEAGVGAVCSASAPDTRAG